MQVVFIRHAIAEAAPTSAEAAPDDAARSLTPKGRKRMQQVARGLRVLVPRIDLVATSPYTRALQSAQIVSSVYGGLTLVELDVLASGSERRDVLTWLQKQRDDRVIGMVGHEPDLGMLVSGLLAAPESHFVEFKKGGACLLDWPANVTAGDAVLRWLVTPSQLRGIAKAEKK
jgi:phosphohistidine phosphatase